MPESPDHAVEIAKTIEELLRRRFRDMNLDPNDVADCAAQISLLLHDRGTSNCKIAETVRAEFGDTAGPAPMLSEQPADVRFLISDTQIIAGSGARTWRRFIPIVFVLAAWFTFWLLLFGLDRRTWLVASEIAATCTVAVAAALAIWGWLERSFGGR